MKTGYTVADAMTTKPVTCSPTTTLKECAQLMKHHDVGSLLVIDNDELAGIITEEDFVHKAAVQGLNLNTAVAQDIMSDNLVVVEPGTDIFDALNIMNEHRIRHLPVMEEGKLRGLITLRTILKIEPQLIELIAERIELRGISPESPLLESFETELSSGQCESCGNYSNRLIERDGKKLCPNCAYE